MQLLYIDSNIYLEYFRENSSERIAPLQELVKLVKEEKVKLLIPSQTQQEYFRNRRNEAESTRASLVQQSKLSFIVPATFDKNTPEIKEITKSVKGLAKTYKKLIKKYDTAVEKVKTDVDLLIEELFNDLGEDLLETDEIIHQSYSRYMKGNPPRKSDHSYGDAIIWETLLKNGSNDNLIVISKDGDFIEKHKGKKVLNSFLEAEWKTKKNKKAKLYTSLAEFINTTDSKKIKKEVVEREKKRSDLPKIATIGEGGYNSDGGLLMASTAGSSLNSSVSSIGIMQTRPFVVGGGSGGGLFTLSSNGSLNNNDLIFCPYCGNEIDKDFPVYHGLTYKKYHCVSCNKNFNFD